MSLNLFVHSFERLQRKISESIHQVFLISCMKLDSHKVTKVKQPGLFKLKYITNELSYEVEFLYVVNFLYVIQ